MTPERRDIQAQGELLDSLQLETPEQTSTTTPGTPAPPATPPGA